MNRNEKNTPFAKVPQFLFWAIFTVVVCGISTITSFQPIFANIPFNVVLPVLVLIFRKPVFFEKMKLMTLIVMRALIVVAVFGLIKGDLYVTIVLVFLAINILEATITDFKHKSYYNFVTGLIMTATIFFFFGDATRWIVNGQYSTIYQAFSQSSTTTYMAIATVCWWIAYTIWNWLFVVEEFSPSIGYLHCGILLCPIISVLLTMNPGYWLIFRANSLTFGGVLQIGYKDMFEKKLENKKMTAFVQKVKTPKVQLSFMILNILLMGVAVVLYFI